MKKYFWTLAVMAIFAIGFAASDEEESSNNSSSTEQTQTKEESNPYAKFVGKYVLYDDDGRTSFCHFKVNEKGHFLQSLYNGEYKNYGTIEPVSDNAFCLSLYGTSKIYIEHEDDKWPWANTDKISCGTRYKYLGPNKTIRFDISEKRMYPDNEEYDNREYQSPHFYKFKVYE